METVVVYSPFISPRLEYVLGWLLRERLQLRFRITGNIADLHGSRFAISYGEAIPGVIAIPACGLLQEKGYRAHQPALTEWSNLPVFYPVDGTECTLPFDLFSALFFLLSRYEEYGEYTPDKHGRYPATASILHRQGLLQRPIADEWVAAFRKELESTWGSRLPKPRFNFRPTYDIDIAYRHLHKGFGRVAGAYLKALLRVDMKLISERTQVLKLKQKDPYDSFRWLRSVHKEYGFLPLYFVLAATKPSRYDKNIHPEHPAMMRVIKNLAGEGAIGIHPSYFSTGGDTLYREKALLEQLAGKNINCSRQHYIRAVVPHTYRQLLHNHISDDFSMGYGSHLGFRAGTGSSFLWYDLENDYASILRVHPFCFMDTTAHYEMELSPSQAFEKLAMMCRLLQQTGSTLITVFHNFSLGTDEEWKGWRQAYEDFLLERAGEHGYGLEAT